MWGVGDELPHQPVARREHGKVVVVDLGGASFDQLPLTALDAPQSNV